MLDPRDVVRVRAVEVAAGALLLVEGDQDSLLDGLPVLGESDLYDTIADRLGASTEGERASALELALEGLYLARRIGKDSDGSETVYG